MHRRRIFLTLCLLLLGSACKSESNRLGDLALTADLRATDALEVLADLENLTDGSVEADLPDQASASPDLAAPDLTGSAPDMIPTYDLLGAPNFQLATTTTTAEITAAGTVSVTVTLTRDPGLTELVSLEISGLPASVTSDDTTKVLVDNTLSATFVLTADVNATESGPHTITIKGTSGVIENSLTFTLLVHEPADFSLAVDPAYLNFPAGQTLNLGVTIGRAGAFTDDVAVSFLGLPAELSASGRVFTTADTGTVSIPVVSQEIFTPQGGSFTVHAESGSIIREVTVSYSINASVDYSITLEPTSKTISRTTAGSVLVKVNRVNSYNGSVSVTVSGLPSGVVASPNPLLIAGAESQAPLLLTVSNSAPLGGPTTVTFAAASSPNGMPKVKNATLDLTIGAAPSFQLTAPATLSVAQDTTANLALGVTRDIGFTAALTSVLQNAQTGVTATGGAFATNGTSSTLNVAASATALLLVPTSTTVSTTDGTVTQTAPVTVTVLPKADPQLDTTFGSSGAAVYNDLGFYVSPRRVRVFPSYAVVATNQGGLHIKTDGTIDTTFGSGGLSGNGMAQWAEFATIADNGDVYYVARTNQTMYLAKVLANGQVDSSYGTNGIAEWAWKGTLNGLSGLELRGDGKLYVYGHTTIGSTTDLAIARFTTTGQLDSTFSSDGMVEIDHGGDDYAHAIVFGASGRAIIVGESNAAAAVKLALARVTDAGALDTGFSGDGLLLISNSTQNYASAVTQLQSGKLLLVGYGGSASTQYLQVTRLNANGNPDTTFDSDGFVTFPTLSKFSPNQVVEDGSNRIVIGGGDDGRYTIIRLTSAGALDSTFSNDGIDTLAGGSSGYESIEALGVHPSTGAYWTFGRLGPRLAGARFVP